MIAKISGCLSLVKAAIDAAEAGAPYTVDDMRRISSLLTVCTDVARQMEAQLCLHDPSPELFAGTNIVSLKPFLEAKSHVRPQA